MYGPMVAVDTRELAEAIHEKLTEECENCDWPEGYEPSYFTIKRVIDNYVKEIMDVNK